VYKNKNRKAFPVFISFYLWGNEKFLLPLRRRPQKEERLKRTRRMTIMLNPRETEALNTYFRRYKVRNRSKFMREAIITAVLRKFDEDYPTLFENESPTLFDSQE